MDGTEKIEVNTNMCSRCAQGMHSGYCGHWHGGRHVLLRVLLMMVILLVTFGVGFKLGEFKGSFGRDMFYGGYSMHGRMPYIMHDYDIIERGRAQRFTVPIPQNDTLPVTPIPTK